MQSTNLKVIVDFTDYEPWSGAVENYNMLEEKGMLDDFEELLAEMYPEGIEMVKINDILWFDFEYVLEMLGLSESEEE